MEWSVGGWVNGWVGGWAGRHHHRYHHQHLRPQRHRHQQTPGPPGLPIPPAPPTPPTPPTPPAPHPPRWPPTQQHSKTYAIHMSVLQYGNGAGTDAQRRLAACYVETVHALSSLNHQLILIVSIMASAQRNDISPGEHRGHIASICGEWDPMSSPIWVTARLPPTCAE